MRIDHSLAAFMAITLFSAGSWGADESDRIAQIQSLSPREKEELAQKKRRFDDLPSAEQERLRKLQAEIDAHPESAQLLNVMQQYHDWLKSLSTNQLADLRSLPEEDRLEMIRRLVEQQRRERQRQAWRKLAEQASPEDLEIVFRWLQEFVDEHRDELIRSMPGSFGRRLAAIPDKERQTLVLMHLMLSSTRIGPGVVRPGKSDVEKLLPQLSADAQRFFNETMDFPRRIQLLSIWSRGALWSKGFSHVTSEQLATFLDKLPAEERDRLERLAPADRDAELRWSYARAQLFRRDDWGPRRSTEGRESPGDSRRGAARHEEPSDDPQVPTRKGPPASVRASSADR